MIPIPFLHRALARIAAFLLGIILGAAFGMNAIAIAGDITYDNFDVGEFRETSGEIQPPTITAEDIRALEQALEDAIRRARTQEAAATLKAAAEHWRVLSKQLDEELEAAARQARKDAKLRSVAGFFRLVAATASVVDAFSSQPADAPDEADSVHEKGSVQAEETDAFTSQPMTDLPGEADSVQLGDTSTHEEGSVQVQEMRERAVRVRMNGEWRTISVDKILYQHTAPPLDTRNPVIPNTIDRLGRLADELPPLACDTKWGGCTAIPSFDDPDYAATPVSNTPERAPTSEESGLLDTVLRFGVDWTPVGDAAAIVTGRDLLTDEKVSRTAAGAGLVVGSVGGPLAKGALKSAQKLWKLGVHKSAMKWVKQFTKRDWTPDKVDEAILKGNRHKAPNYVNPGNGATRYEYQGKSVVRDDVTKEILHVGEEGFKY